MEPTSVISSDLSTWAGMYNRLCTHIHTAVWPQQWLGWQSWWYGCIGFLLLQLLHLHQWENNGEWECTSTTANIHPTSSREEGWDFIIILPSAGNEDIVRKEIEWKAGIQRWGMTTGQPSNCQPPLYVWHRWYWMPQLHTWQPLRMCHQNSVRGPTSAQAEL